MTAFRRRMALVGLGDETPIGLVHEMLPDMLGEWLPLALADILSAWSGARRAEILRGWGLAALAGRCEDADLSAFLAPFHEDADR